MRRISLGLLTLTLFATPAAARAGLLFEASIGSGVRAGIGSTERIPTNVMATLGYGFTDMLKLEVGAVANFGDIQKSYTPGSSVDVDLRGMLVIAPPLFPVYFRAIAGATSLKVQPTNFTYGGAIGLGFSLFGLGAFGEAGAMQRIYQIAEPGVPAVEQKGWQIEGRLGVSFG